MRVPLQADEFGREPIHQHWVRRAVALGAEVLRRCDQAPAEQPIPDLIDPHPGGQGIGAIGQPPGQRQSVADLWRTTGGQHRRHARDDLLPQVQEVATVLHAGFPRLG